jgi:hypothetical protein
MPVATAKMFGSKMMSLRRKATCQGAAIGALANRHFGRPCPSAPLVERHDHDAARRLRAKCRNDLAFLQADGVDDALP